jgi:hypothetical protein
MRIQISKDMDRIARVLKGRNRGQAIVLIALAMVGLLAATGLAVDGALVFARRADLRRGVDAAALAGVVELVDGNQADADAVAQELLAGNGIDVPSGNIGIEVNNCPPDQSCMWSDEPPSVQLGAYRYRVESTMAVPLTFMNVIGINTVRVSAEAEAEYFPQADLFASSTLESGVIKTSIQSIFGPEICTRYGDPYTPNEATGNDGAFNDNWADLQGIYHYRIRIPRTFVDNRDRLRVEIMDPDSYNRADATVTVTHESGTTENIWMDGDRRNGRLEDINDGQSPNNDFWFHRIDEIRGTSTPGLCGQPASYNPEGGVAGNRETSIEFTLFYYQEQGDGSLVRRNLARYTSPRSGVEAPPGGHPTANQHCTDLHWVSPGARQGSSYGYDPLGAQVDGYYRYDICPNGVPADGQAGSAFAFTPATGNGDFQIQLPTIDYGARTCTGGEMTGCAIDPLTDDIFVYLDVRGTAGGSENGFEFWAGPDLSVYDIPTEMNERNVFLLTSPGGVEATHGSEGVAVSGLGHLPLNSNTDNQVDIPLMYVGPQLAGQTIRISLFDPDSGSNGPITFFFDTIPQADWSYITCDNSEPSAPNCDQPAGEQNSPGQHIVGDDRNNQWIDPPFEFVVPSESDTPPIVFVGGILNANYQAGWQDTYGWLITVESRPYLVE